MTRFLITSDLSPVEAPGSEFNVYIYRYIDFLPRPTSSPKIVINYATFSQGVVAATVTFVIISNIGIQLVDGDRLLDFWEVTDNCEL